MQHCHSPVQARSQLDGTISISQMGAVPERVGGGIYPNSLRCPGRGDEDSFGETVLRVRRTSSWQISAHCPLSHRSWQGATLCFLTQPSPERVWTRDTNANPAHPFCQKSLKGWHTVSPDISQDWYADPGGYCFLKKIF